MRWLHAAREDLWCGCRRLTRDLTATTAVALVLSCGIGLSVAMFSVADTMLRRPLPVLDQERVVVLWGEGGGSMRTLPLSPRHFERFRDEAQAKRLRRIVVVQAVWLCGVGLAIGLASGVACARLLGTLLYGVVPTDLYTVSGVVVLLMTTSVAASYVPARGATRTDVAALVRDE